jgi:hypothetical protein
VHLPHYSAKPEVLILGKYLAVLSSLCFSKILTKKVTGYVTRHMPAPDLTDSSKLTEKQSKTTPQGKPLE